MAIAFFKSVLCCFPFERSVAMKRSQEASLVKAQQKERNGLGM